MASFDSHRELVTKFITSHVPDAQLKQDTQQEFVFVLPDTCVKRGAFQKFFRALEQHKVELDIDSYGLTDTTLEEVRFWAGVGSGTGEKGGEPLKREAEDELPLKK